MQLPVEHSRYAPLVFRRLTCCSSAQMRILATTAKRRVRRRSNPRRFD